VSLVVPSCRSAPPSLDVVAVACAVSACRSVEVFEEEEMVGMQTQLMHRVARVTLTPLAVAGIMLTRYKWDAQVCARA